MSRYDSRPGIGVGPEDRLMTKSPLVSLRPEVQADIRIATLFRVPVLITASPDTALEIAHAIAVNREEVVVCDATVPKLDRGAGILLLREVHRLSARGQARLAALMTARHDERGITPRIVASSSVCLFDLVREGKFDETLFYRLNTIHIAIAYDRTKGSHLTALSC
jgi:hypothetical protein